MNKGTMDNLESNNPNEVVINMEATTSVAADTPESSNQTKAAANGEITEDTSPAMENPESSNHTDAATRAEIMEVVENPESSNQTEAATHTDITEAKHVTPEHVKLYHAALRGDWGEAETIINGRKGIVREKISSASDYPLHIAVVGKHMGFVENLLGIMKQDDLIRKNKEENTALHIAAALGFVEIAMMLVNKDEKKHGVANMVGGGEMIPIHLAALFCHKKMVKYLYTVTNFEGESNKNVEHLFHAIISADTYDVAMCLLEPKNNTTPIPLSQSAIRKALHLMACKPNTVLSHKDQLNWFQKFVNCFSKGFFVSKPNLAHQLVVKLWGSFVHAPGDLDSKIAKLLFDAAESGNVEFLLILIRSNPELIWISDDKDRSLFHIAALHRQDSIFNIKFELGGLKNYIASYIDKKTKNNMLHLVAHLPHLSRLQIVPGAALQMQRELHWFKAVEKIVPRSYIEKKNADGLVPRELFTRAHENLCKEGEKWMRDTATACMLVATLIATMVFAAAFTLPGGNVSSDNKDNTTKVGFPQFRKMFWFDMFIISDSVALLSSVTSIVLFLSILTSRYAEKDFLIKLPAKLTLGLLALFVSIISMVLGFTAAMILIRDNEPKWSLILIIFLAFLVAIAFAWSHMTIWYETTHLLHSSWGSKSTKFDLIKGCFKYFLRGCKKGRLV